MPPPWSSGQRGWGQSEPWTGGMRGFFWGGGGKCRRKLRVLEPSHMNGGGRTETPPGQELRGFRVQFPRKGRGACSSSPAPSPQVPSPQAGAGSTENPTHPPNVHYALGTPILSQRENSSRKTGRGCSRRGSSERVQRGATG